MNSFKRLLLVIILSFAIISFQAVAYDNWITLSPSIRYLHRTTSQPWSMHFLFIDMCDPGVSFRATMPDERGQVVSMFGSSSGILSAINGDFFSFESYATVGLAVGNGERWTDTADTGLEGFVAFGDEKRFTLSVPSDVVEPPAIWMHQVVSGRPLIVHSGVKVPPSEPSHMFTRQPRTAVGFDEDSYQLIFFVVDGRQPSLSVGMTWEEMADTLIAFGADEVLNLDGGGSSTFWINGYGVLNSPSDGHERVVANHLGVKFESVPPDYPSLCCFHSVDPSADGIFRDLPSGHPARDYAEAMFDAGIISGCQESPRLFCPSCRASRAITITVILKAMGESQYFPPSPTFADVPPDHQAYGWIEQAYRIGLTSGCRSDPPLFCPERTTTRAELAVFVQRGSGIEGYAPSEPTFSDLEPTHWAYSSVEALNRECLEIQCNLSPPAFCPHRPITRTEMVSFIAQAFDIGREYGCNESEYESDEIKDEINDEFLFEFNYNDYYSLDENIVEITGENELANEKFEFKEGQIIEVDASSGYDVNSTGGCGCALLR